MPPSQPATFAPQPAATHAPPLQVAHNWSSMLLSALCSALLATQLPPEWQRSAPRLANGARPRHRRAACARCGPAFDRVGFHL
jgi:hypothetical protein